MEKAMTKLTLLGVAAVAAYAALTASVAAQSRVTTHSYAAYNGYAGTCPGHEAGNPYDPATDYWLWSSWRARGGWDDRNDQNCMPNRMIRGEY